MKEKNCVIQYTNHETSRNFKGAKNPIGLDVIQMDSFDDKWIEEFVRQFMNFRRFIFVGLLHQVVSDPLKLHIFLYPFVLFSRSQSQLKWGGIWLGGSILVTKTAKGGMDPLTKKVSGMSMNSGRDGDWVNASKKNKNRGGGSGGRQWESQITPPKAWGQADTAQRLGIGGSGPSWAAKVGSQAAKSVQKQKEEIPKIPSEEEDDDGEDDEDDAFDDDDDLLSDEDADGNPQDHESLKKHKLLKVFFETLDKLSVEEINDTTRQWHCPACQGGPGAIDWYKGLQPLASHARTKGSKRVKLHRLFCKLLEDELQIRGTSSIPAGEAFGNWEGLKTETKDHEIIWPPMVLVLNTRLDKGDDDKWLGMGNQELVNYFSNYSPVKARHSYGPQGHRGISLLLFESSVVGYLEAERLHKHFLEQGTGRDAWEKRRNLFCSGGRRQLYGCLATKDDVQFFNQHCQGKQKMKYEMRSYNEMVVSQMKKMSEDNQQLSYLKHKHDVEKRQNKVMKESVSFLSNMVKKQSEENRIVKQRSKMHHEQNQQELDFQDNFFKEQMELIQESMTAKEDSFEKFLQDERKKAEFLNLHSSSAEDSRLRIEEFEKSQDKEISQFVTERDELEKVHKEKLDDLKKRYQDDMLAMVEEFKASLTRLIENMKSMAIWHAKKGQQSIGTPASMLSKVEFQPLWVRNPPMARWARTSSCGAQLTMQPLSFVPSRISGSMPELPESFPMIKSGRMTHKKGLLLITKPTQNSINSSLLTTVMLPKLT
ncbi:hypothetical protein V2J09_007779 [Rumex salicifolius]